MDDKKFDTMDIRSYCTTDAEKKAHQLFCQFFEERDFTKLETTVFNRIDNIIKDKYGCIADTISEDADSIKEFSLAIGFIEGYLYALQHIKEDQSITV